MTAGGSLCFACLLMSIIVILLPMTIFHTHGSFLLPAAVLAPPVTACMARLSCSDAPDLGFTTMHRGFPSSTRISVLRASDAGSFGILFWLVGLRTVLLAVAFKTGRDPKKTCAGFLLLISQRHQARIAQCASSDRQLCKDLLAEKKKILRANIIKQMRFLTAVISETVTVPEFTT